MIESTPAPCCIPATTALLEGWTGPVEEFVGPGDAWAESVVLDGRSVIPRPGERRYRLDPTRREVLHHLVDRLALPEWVRGLRAEVGAFCCVCAAHGATVTGLQHRARYEWEIAHGPHGLLIDVREPFSGLGGGALREAKQRAVRAGRPVTWTWRAGANRGESPDHDSALDSAMQSALAAGCILHNGDHLLGPGPGGVVWWWPLTPKENDDGR